jgi:pimeloyl-ACP methyl ester carboxylesterase
MHNEKEFEGFKSPMRLYKSMSLSAILLISTVFLALAAYGLWEPDLGFAELQKRYGSTSSNVVNVDGMRIHYKDTGPQDAPVLLFLHGFGSSLQTWDVWAVTLEQKYRVIRLDLPGFGLTGPSPSNDYSELNDVSTLTQFVDKLGISDLSVIGHSMGGKIAWTFAAAHPDRVKALVLMAPDGFPQPEAIGTKPYAMPAIMGLMKYCLPRYFVRKSIEPAFANESALDDKMVSRYHDMLRAPGVRAAILERGNQTIYTDPVPRLKKIKAPTLLLWGEEDKMIPSSNATSYAGVLAQSKTVFIPKLGHLLHEEQADIGLAQLVEFLDARLLNAK